jgi:hypothetical protein
MTPLALRRRRGVLCVGIMLVLVHCCFGSIATAANGGRPLFTGVTGIYDYDDPSALSNVKATGAKFVRIQVDWFSVAPDKMPSVWRPDDPADPNYDWSTVDTAVTGAVSQGLTPLLSVNYAPTWAQNCDSPEAFAGIPCNPAASALADFATAAARRYDGRSGLLPSVRYWQGLNEPNLDLYFHPQYRGGEAVSARLYRPLINAFYAAVKSVHRSNIVVAAGLGPIAVPNLTVGPMRFTRELLCMTGRRNPRPKKGTCEGGVRFDVFDIHPFTTGGPTHRGGVDDVQMGDLSKLRRLLRAADRAGRIHGQFKSTPVWITEVGWDSKPPDPGGLSMKIATRWTAESIYRAWEAGISHFFWYSLRDSKRKPNTPFSQTNESGLFLRGPTVDDDQPKRLFYAFRFPFVSYPGKTLAFWGRTPASSAGKVSIQVKKDRWRTIATTRADGNGIFRGSLKTNYGGNHRGSVRARFGDEVSPGFSMHPVGDFYQPPFG